MLTSHDAPCAQPVRNLSNGDPRYLPTPDEIRQACIQIQAEWTDEERIYRRTAAAAELRGHRKAGAN